MGGWGSSEEGLGLLSQATTFAEAVSRLNYCVAPFLGKTPLSFRGSVKFAYVSTISRH